MILSYTSAIIILYRGNKMATEFLIACVLFTIQIIEILRAKILKQILLRLFCRERVGVIFAKQNQLWTRKRSYHNWRVSVIITLNCKLNRRQTGLSLLGGCFILLWYLDALKCWFYSFFLIYWFIYLWYRYYLNLTVHR